MFLDKYKYIKNFKIAIFLLSIVLLLCSTMVIHAIQSNSQSMEMTTIGCCSHNDNAGFAHISYMSATITSNFSNLLFFIALFSFIALITYSKKEILKAVNNYINLIREKYGGYVILNYFTQLFKTGILNPKIFS